LVVYVVLVVATKEFLDTRMDMAIKADAAQSVIV